MIHKVDTDQHQRQENACRKRRNSQLLMHLRAWVNHQRSGHRNNNNGFQPASQSGGHSKSFKLVFFLDQENDLLRHVITSTILIEKCNPRINSERSTSDEKTCCKLVASAIKKIELSSGFMILTMKMEKKTNRMSLGCFKGNLLENHGFPVKYGVYLVFL